MGTKYIIEIEDDEFIQNEGNEILYRAKGFKSLVFDQNGLDKLTPLKEVKYDTEKNVLHVGDEVVTSHPKDGSDYFGVIVKEREQEERVQVLMEDFTFCFPKNDSPNFRKTGRRIPIDRIFSGSR